MRYELTIPVDVELRSTLIDSAQCFYWHEADDCFWTVMRSGGDAEAVYAYQLEQGVRLEAETPLNEAFWRNYFDCGRDYASLPERFGWHEKMAEALNAAQGLRVLRQDAWETVLSFILSANNNVGRIRTLTAALSREYGTPVETRYGMACVSGKKGS